MHSGSVTPPPRPPPPSTLCEVDQTLRPQSGPVQAGLTSGGMPLDRVRKKQAGVIGTHRFNLGGGGEDTLMKSECEGTNWVRRNPHTIILVFWLCIQLFALTSVSSTMKPSNQTPPEHRNVGVPSFPTVGSLWKPLPLREIRQLKAPHS